MNASNLYISTCRLVLRADPENHSTWTDLDTLLPNLRLALSCNVCGNILQEPHSPTSCDHHVCRQCLGSSKTIKTYCIFCKDHEMHVENKQLSIIVLCYKKLCDFLRISPIYRKLIEVVNEGGPQDLLNIIDEFNVNSEEPKSELSIVNDVYRTLALDVSTEKDIDSVIENNLLTATKTDNSLDSVESFINDSDIVLFNKISESSPQQLDTSPSDRPILVNCDDAEIDDASLSDNVPILSPIPEQSENFCTDNLDSVATISSVQLFQSTATNVSELTENSPVIQDEENELVEGSDELIISQSAILDSTSEAPSSESSVSSPLQISPALPSQGDSPDEDIQEQLDEYSLATSLTTHSVLDLQPSPDLIESTGRNVLDSLDDDASYGDLADINLSSCPLTSLGEDTIKDEIISISGSVLSLQSSIGAINPLPKNSLYCINSSKYELDNRELLEVSPQVSSPCSFSIFSSQPNTVLKSEINSVTDSHTVQPQNQIPISSIFTPQSINDFVTRNNPTIAVIPSPSNLITNTNSIIHHPIQSHFSHVSPSTNFVRANINSHVLTSPLLSPNNIRTAVLSPPSCQTPTTSNNVYHGLPSQLIQTPLSSSHVVQASVLSNQVIQQSITSHHILHKTITSNQLIPKSLPLQTISNPSVSTCHIGNNNLVVNQLSSTNDIQTPKIFFGNSNPITSHQTYQTPLNQTKFAPISQSPISNICYSTNSAVNSTPTLTSSFLNILPAGTIFHSTNIQNKSPVKETQLKNTPNGSSVYSVMFSEGDSTKITIKRTPPENKPLISNHHMPINPPLLRPDQVAGMHIHNNSNMNQNLMKKPLKPKSKPKPKPKRKGCRCGNATPSPGKLTCCGQRCPCYVEAKACIECRCKGCRNPHRPGGKKVRPIIPHQANIQIHQIQPVQGRVVTGLSKVTNSIKTVPMGLQQNQFSHQQHLIHNANTPNTSLNVSTSQTIRTLQAIHAVKAVQGINSVQSFMGGNQLNMKECVIDNTLHSSITHESMIPVSNIISMKPIKVRLDSITNPLIKNEKLSHSADSDSASDLDIDE